MGFKLVCENCKKEITINESTYIKDIEKMWEDEIYVSLANYLIIRCKCNNKK